MRLSTLCYVKKDGRTLMLHRVKKKNDVHEGKWNGLGGKLEQGESPEECVIREVREESGLTIRNPKLCGMITFPLFSNCEDEYTFIFTAAEFEGELIDSPEGNLEWIEDSKLLSLNLWDGDWLFMEWMEKGRFFSGKMIYENGHLVDHQVVFY